ncbi:hypothetical protein DFH08DRAFT_691820, partial [Mycena albidolilacea]
LSADIRKRVLFVINGMHAYRHHWACQLVYNPNFREGMGLADHEGVKHFWSQILKLIPLTRGQWVHALTLHFLFDLKVYQNSRCIWMTDQYTAFMSAEGCASLGNWIHRQQRKNLTPKHHATMATLRDCQVPVQELCVQWEAQKLAQTSIRCDKGHSVGIKMYVIRIRLCSSSRGASIVK